MWAQKHRLAVAAMNIHSMLAHYNIHHNLCRNPGYNPALWLAEDRQTAVSSLCYRHHTVEPQASFQDLRWMRGLFVTADVGTSKTHLG